MPTIEPFAFRSSKLLLFGADEVDRVGEQAARFGARALVVAGQGSARLSGALDRVARSLSAAGVKHAVYDSVPPEPPIEAVDRGRARGAEFETDLVIALGGGSALDVGKAIAGLALTDKSAREFHGKRSCDAPGVPCIAIPTTSGTGSEVTPNSVLTDPQRGVKTSIRGDALLPEVAIVDPTLTLSLPPEPTAHSGLDALCQAVEAFVSRSANPVSDAVALRACGLIAGSLEAAFDDGANLEARTDMALGSVLAGMALASARLGIVHGLAHPLGVLLAKPHGLLCGAMLPLSVRANASCAAERYARIAREAGCASGPSDAAATEALADWLEGLCASLGVPTRLGRLGLEADQIAGIADRSAGAGSSAYNPRAFTPSELAEVLRENL